MDDHKFNPKRRGRLCSPERLRLLPPFKILRQVGLKKGDVFVDIGCGTGFFSMPAAAGFRLAETFLVNSEEYGLVAEKLPLIKPHNLEDKENARP